MPLKLVSFDLDGTLIHPAIFNAVADALGFGAPLEKSYRAYLDGTMTLEEAFHHDYAHFVGRPVAAMHEALARSPRWTLGIPEAVARLHGAGLRVIVTTDQPRFLAEFTRRFGVDHVVCSEAAVRDGRVTADVRPAFAKWPNLQAYLAREGVAPSDVAHVGNGRNDVPVFRNVGESVAVNAEHPDVTGAARRAIPRLKDLREVCDALLD
jgi:phosphoserine phosphatase